MKKLCHIVVFASGTGTNFRNIHQGILQGSIPGKIDLLISNNEGCGAVGYAGRKGIDCLIISNLAALYEDILIRELEKLSPDLIILAGYIKLIPSVIVRKFRQRIINIHPALLPSFGGKGMYGINVHKAVLASKQTVSGATVHFVDEKYDHGPIVDQQTVPVLPTDTASELAGRVLEIEHVLYPRVVKAFCEGRIIWENNLPRILPDKQIQE